MLIFTGFVFLLAAIFIYAPFFCNAGFDRTSNISYLFYILIVYHNVIAMSIKGLHKIITFVKNKYNYYFN